MPQLPVIVTVLPVTVPRPWNMATISSRASLQLAKLMFTTGPESGAAPREGQVVTQSVKSVTLATEKAGSDCRELQLLHM